MQPVLSLLGKPAFGYLLKDRVIELSDFLEAAERIATGGTALDPDVVQALVRSVFAKLNLYDYGTNHRRVLAAVRYLDSR